MSPGALFGRGPSQHLFLSGGATIGALAGRAAGPALSLSPAP